MTTTYPVQAQNYIIPNYNQMSTYATQEPSPASSASPTSPRLNEYLHNYAPNPAKQLRPLKSPLYVPACLRPNEHYSQSPMTPPKSLHGSVDNLQDGGNRDDPQAMAQHELDLALQQEFAAQGEQLNDVTGPPTREHWKPDEASPNCDSPECRSSFNLFVRKHHCRHCGHIFCASHTNYTIPLDQSAKFHPDGVPSKACETCHRQYQRWDTARSIRRKNSDNSDDSGSATPIVESRPEVHRIISVRGGQKQPAVANSVPRDWAWSTF